MQRINKKYIYIPNRRFKEIMSIIQVVDKLTKSVQDIVRKLLKWMKASITWRKIKKRKHG